MSIRPATGSDRDDIRDVHRAAFSESEREIVSRLAVDLLSETTTPPTISLVAETDGAVVGHVAFSPMSVDDGEHLQGYILAPLAVRPDHQRRRIGSLLIESGTQRLSGMGIDVVLVYGDPGYYGRFGFTVDAAERYVPPYGLQYPFGWQGLALSERGIPESPVRIGCVAPLRDPALW